MGIKIGTFNAENLFLRYKFLGKKVDQSIYIKEGWRIEKMALQIFDEGQRKNTARVILENDPDVICLQEVENLATLKQFNSNYLNRKYPYAMLIDGNDPRQIDVGILSKLEIGGVRTHQFDKDKMGKKIFSRDCLKPILDGSLVENVVARLPKNEQWTHYWEAKHEINQFDYILLSRALSKKNPNVLPKIERRGLADYAKAYKGPRFPGVGKENTEASDHCAVFMEINT